MAHVIRSRASNHPAPKPETESHQIRRLPGAPGVSSERGAAEFVELVSGFWLSGRSTTGHAESLQGEGRASTIPRDATKVAVCIPQRN